MADIEIIHDGLQVGRLKDLIIPVRKGEMAYEPYRSEGHYRLAQALSAGNPVKCHLEREGRRVTFDVVGTGNGEKHTLLVDNVRSERLGSFQDTGTRVTAPMSLSRSDN